VSAMTLGSLRSSGCPASSSASTSRRRTRAFIACRYLPNPKLIATATSMPRFRASSPVNGELVARVVPDFAWYADPNWSRLANIQSIQDFWYAHFLLIVALELDSSEGPASR
jgi:hypothetical protein